VRRYSYINKKVGYKMKLEINNVEMGYCDSCGNYVPVVEDEGSLVCGYEFAEYPELATVIG
jgi:hypothetical protein